MNLARIRDNQRRSRARRKDYLHELEAKWRVCEQLGVEASAEMQSAARKVLDENKRLRALLRQRGMADDEIDSFAVGAAPSTPCDSLRGSPGPADLQSPAPSARLAKMLATRQPISARRTNNLPVTSSPTESIELASVQMPRRVTTPMSIAPQLTPIIPFAMSPSPQSMASSTVSTPTSMMSPELFSATPAPPSSDPGDFSHLPSSYPFGPSSPFDNHWAAYQAPLSATSVPDMSYACADAASIIRGMRSDDGIDLNTDLSCGALAADCKVDNMAVYGVMDKFVQHQRMMWR